MSSDAKARIKNRETEPSQGMPRIPLETVSRETVGKDMENCF